MENIGEDERVHLPASEQKLQELYLDSKNHPAKMMADNAMKMKRSPTKVFILLVGLTGGGKSSSVDYLFGTNVGKTKPLSSAEDSTIEYTLQLNSSEYSIQNLQLSIIDTPSFGHVDGFTQDAKNILSIKHFLETNPFIRNQYPNLVMITLDITDPRTEGHDSDFAKMLRGISKINAIDISNRNVVVVLTHAASIARKPKIWEEKVAVKKKQLKAIVKYFLGITPEIVVQENDPEGNDLKHDGDCFILPNGEKQPMILYQACVKLLKAAKDEIGHETVAVCFRPGIIKNVTTESIISSSEVQMADIKAMQSILTKSQENILTSEVGRKLEMYKNRKIAKEIVNDIFILQIRLGELKIWSVGDLLNMSMDQLVAKTSITKEMQKVVAEVFGLSCEESAGRKNHVKKIDLPNQPCYSDNDGSNNSLTHLVPGSPSPEIQNNRSSSCYDLCCSLKDSCSDLCCFLKDSCSDLCCFPEDSLIMLHNQKQKQMKDLSVGDKVLTFDSDGTLIQDEVIAWLHQVRDGQFTFLQIVHDNGKITLSSEHIIFVGNSRFPKHASSLSKGDKLFFSTDENDRQTVTIATVLSIRTVKRRGIYAPLTYSGRVLVDNVDVSCYSYINSLQVVGKDIISSHALAHFGFLPLRIAYKLGFNISYRKFDDGSGIHGYARWLMHIVMRK